MNATPVRGQTVGPVSRPGGGAPVAVEVLVCGSTDRADDGAPVAAAHLLGSTLPAGVAVRTVGQLDIDHLLAIDKDAGVVVVDTATGIDAGAVVELPLSGLIGREDRIHPRSSHALAIREVVGLAEMIRGRPFRGRIVAIGGVQFGHGRPFSRPVAAALPTLSAAVLEAIEHVRPTDGTTDGSS